MIKGAIYMLVGALAGGVGAAACTVFVNWSFNFGEWTEHARAALVLCVLTFGALGGAFGRLIYDEMRHEK